VHELIKCCFLEIQEYFNSILSKRQPRIDDCLDIHIPESHQCSFLGSSEFPEPQTSSLQLCHNIRNGLFTFESDIFHDINEPEKISSMLDNFLLSSIDSYRKERDLNRSSMNRNTSQSSLDFSSTIFSPLISNTCKSYRAALFFNRGNYIEAKRAFDSTQSACPGYSFLGEIYVLTLWHLRDIHSLLRIRSIWGDNLLTLPLSILSHVCIISISERHDQAIDSINDYISREPLKSYYGFQYLLANELLLVDDFKSAKSVFSRIPSDSLFYQRSLIAIGICSYRSLEYSQCIPDFEKSILEPFHDPRAYTYLGSAYHKVGDLNQALRYLYLATTTNVEDSKARFLKASILGDTGNIEESIKDLWCLSENAQKEASVYSQMGVINRRIGNHAISLRSFTLAHDRDPGNSQILSQLEKYRMR
jgi:hypothetical protein